MKAPQKHKIISGEVNADMVGKSILSTAIQYMQIIRIERECTLTDAKTLTVKRLEKVMESFTGDTSETD